MSQPRKDQKKITLTTFRNGQFSTFLFLSFSLLQQEEVVKAEEAKQESAGESPAETAAEVTTPTEGTPASPNTATSPESKETKKKEKVRFDRLEVHRQLGKTIHKLLQQIVLRST